MADLRTLICRLDDPAMRSALRRAAMREGVPLEPGWWTQIQDMMHRAAEGLAFGELDPDLSFDETLSGWYIARDKYDALHLLRASRQVVLMHDPEAVDWLAWIDACTEVYDEAMPF